LQGKFGLDFADGCGRLHLKGAPFFVGDVLDKHHSTKELEPFSCFSDDVTFEIQADIIFLLKKRGIDYKYLELLQHRPSFALEENNEGVLVWPFANNWTIPAFIKTFPSFIKLKSGDGIQPFVRTECIESDDGSFVNQILTPFKSLGIKFVVSGVNCKRDFELMKYAADGFMGSWITEQVNGNKYEIQ